MPVRLFFLDSSNSAEPKMYVKILRTLRMFIRRLYGNYSMEVVAKSAGCSSEIPRGLCILLSCSKVDFQGLRTSNRMEMVTLFTL